MIYRALADSLRTLASPDHFDSIAPTTSARYRTRVARSTPPLADVYLPRAPTGASVLLVHGGGFFVGSRRMKPMRFLASRLAAAGVAACVIDYRLVFRGGRIDEATDDVSAAIDFWRGRLPQHDLDPARVSLVGLSAGATLSFLAASRALPGTLHRLVSVFGLYELDHLRGPLATLVPRLVFETNDRADWHARSPRGVASPAIPTLLLHGTADGLVPVEQARRLAEHRVSLGLATKLVVYEGAPHGFFNFPNDACERGVTEITDFVR